MENYLKFLEKNRKSILVLTTMLVAVLCISLKDLAYEGNYRIWFDKDSSIIKNYERFRTTFSGDDTFYVSFKNDDGIFSEKPVSIILDLTEEFKKIEGVQKVDSLTNYQHISSEEDDLIVEDFIYDFYGLDEKEKLALNDALIKKQLISEDGKTTLISIRLSTLQGSDEEVNIRVFQSLKEILQEKGKITGYSFYISGAPAITASLVTISQRDAMILMPLAVIAVVALLFILFRSLTGVLVPSVIIVFTFLSVLSIQILSGYRLNNFTVNIPSFVTAIAIADSMHLYLAWIYYRVKKLSNKEAVGAALKSNIIPIGLTSFTTAVGFASLGLSKIEPISTLGIAITSGAVIAFVLSVTVAPAILLLVPENVEAKKVTLFNFLNTKGYGSFIRRNDRKIIGIFSITFLIIASGIAFVKVDSNSIKYFGKNTTVREGSDFIEKNLTGSMIYEVILDSKAKEGVKNPRFLQKAEAFEKDLKEKFQNVTFTTSLKDIIKRMNEVLNSDPAIPKEKNLVAQYLLLYSMSLPQGMEINDKIDINERYLRLTMNSNIVDTSKDLKMIEWIEKWWAKNTVYSAEVQGQTSIFAYMQSSVTDTLVLSICVTLFIVSLSMIIIFKRFKMLWIFILPNIAPVILVAGIMGYLGIDIDIGIAISAAVILGIAVDDTIHFFSKYFDAIKTKSFEETIDYIISHSGNAMVLTTFILSVTFGLFVFSSFIPNVHFAIVTVAALNLALLFDLILLPAMLSLFYHKKRREQ